ncbi:hypothetical protein FOZ76_00415 [Verticiella sediminum]|uniref:Molybdenum cofactor sulfurase middle domain-containing protein n=1 Tax=Verticiella sediminum TaxID=1247510 RepID=A0A556B212_9BURK|nr:MOSC N-terminal beta barrel domain-containing protein [Verticiella sediminum]TSH99231.1 hypothetical protein FOZ76_00415 [Verticiella sediminum]
MTQTAYPIDGCGALEDEDADKYQAQWLLVTPEFEPIDLDEHPALDQVSLKLHLGYLVITAPGMLRLDIVPDVLEDDESVWRTAHRDGIPFSVVDEGDLAAAWFSNYLGTPVRLAKRMPEGSKPAE